MNNTFSKQLMIRVKIWFRSLLVMVLVSFSLINVAEAQFVYVTNAGDNNISVIDTLTNTVTATIPVGLLPSGISTTPDGTQAFVGAINSNRVDVVDTTTNSLVTSIAACTNPAGCNPAGSTVTPDGTEVWVAAVDEIWVIDTASHTLIQKILVTGSQPHEIAFTPDGTVAFVTMKTGPLGDIDVIDTATASVIATINVGGQPQGIVISGTNAWVARPTGGGVVIFDTSSLLVLNTILMPFPFDVVLSPDGSTAYVSNTTTNQVSVIDTASQSVVTTVGVGGAPKGIAITPSGSHVYVANENSNNVSVVATATPALIATVAVGQTPRGIAVAAACVDVDGDGFGFPGSASCPLGAAEDCADEDVTIYPGQLELPGNTIDENCDGSLGACDPTEEWRNHGQFVRCVAHEVNDLVDGGFLSSDEGDDLVTSAAQSDVGK